jgi:hypothetical protein
MQKLNFYARWGTCAPNACSHVSRWQQSFTRSRHHFQNKDRRYFFAPKIGIKGLAKLFCYWAFWSRTLSILTYLMRSYWTMKYVPCWYWNRFALESNGAMPIRVCPIEFVAKVPGGKSYHGDIVAGGIAAPAAGSSSKAILRIGIE